MLEASILTKALTTHGKDVLSAIKIAGSIRDYLTRDNGDLAELYLSLLERRLRNARLELPALTATYPHVIA